MTPPPVNALGQPIGAALIGWTPPPLPPREPIEGRYVRVEPIDERFAADLHAANLNDADGRNWTYLPYGPFAHEAEYRHWMATTCFGTDPLFHAILDRTTGRAMGLAAYMRIAPESGAIEVGHVHFSPLLQRARGATEAMYLMMQRAFALGLPAVRVEVRRPQRPVTGRRRAPGLFLRGRLPAGHCLQRTQPGHGVVHDDRLGLAGPGPCLRGLAGSGEFRRDGTPALEAERTSSDACHHRSPCAI